MSTGSKQNGGNSKVSTWKKVSETKERKGATQYSGSGGTNW